MSAFIVSDKHINYLLTYANKERIDVCACVVDGDTYKTRYICESSNVDSLQQAAQMMLAENYRSVNHRYSEQDEPHQIKFEFVRSVPFAAVQVIKAVQCLRYQCCETPDFDETDTARLLDHIESHAIGKLPDYDKAAWEIR